MSNILNDTHIFCLFSKQLQCHNHFLKLIRRSVRRKVSFHHYNYSCFSVGLVRNHTAIGLPLLSIGCLRYNHMPYMFMDESMGVHVCVCVRAPLAHCVSISVTCQIELWSVFSFACHPSLSQSTVKNVQTKHFCFSLLFIIIGQTFANKAWTILCQGIIFNW